MSKQLKLPRVADNPAHDDVGAALHLLRDALAEEAQRINEEGAKAMKTGDYPTAEGVLDFAKRLLAFRSRVESLGKEWAELEGLRDKSSEEVPQIVSKRFFGRRPPLSFQIPRIPMQPQQRPACDQQREQQQRA